MINNIKSLDCLKAIWIQGHLYMVKLLHSGKNESNNSRLGHSAVSQARSKCKFYVIFIHQTQIFKFEIFKVWCSIHISPGLSQQLHIFAVNRSLVHICKNTNE